MSELTIDKSNTEERGNETANGGDNNAIIPGLQAIVDELQEGVMGDHVAEKESSGGVMVEATSDIALENLEANDAPKLELEPDVKESDSDLAPRPAIAEDGDENTPLKAPTVAAAAESNVSDVNETHSSNVLKENKQETQILASCNDTKGEEEMSNPPSVSVAPKSKEDLQPIDNSAYNHQMQTDLIKDNNISHLEASDIEVPSLNKEILFDDSIFNIQALDEESYKVKEKLQGWTNKKWAEVQPHLKFHGSVTKLIQEKRMFWSSESHVKRTLAIFTIHKTNLILILRDPANAEEIIRLLPITNDSPIPNEELSLLMKSFLVAESVIDPLTCKMRVSQLSMPTSVPLDYNSTTKLDSRKKAFFELLTPNESLHLSAITLSEKDTDVQFGVDDIVKTTNIEDALSDTLSSAYAFAYGQNVHRHQIVLGTLHSYVISGNDKLLQDGLTNALRTQKSNSCDGNKVLRLDSSIIDERDLNWKTPLHYACEQKRPTTISMLTNSGANCMIPTVDGQTPLHLCAERLDDKCLSILLSATHPSRPDPNALDSLGRTAMYLAAVKGNDVAALARCLSALNAWGGQFLPVKETDESKQLLHPIHCIASQWKYEELQVILSHVNYQYPLINSELGGISLGAKYGYPIHAAIISIRVKMHAAVTSFKEDSVAVTGQFITKTIQTLLNHGFEPNERFEGIVGEGDITKNLSQYFGFTPLQILALTAKEMKSIELQKHDNGGLKKQVIDAVQLTANVLIRNGARTNLPPPPETRLGRDIPIGCYSLQEAIDHSNETPLFSRKELILDDDIVISLFGGTEMVKACQTCFATLTKVTNSMTEGAPNIQIDLSSVKDSNEPGGSDSSSCAICWSGFGVISNRRQFCQVSTRFVCNDCSTHRIHEKGRDVRVSDGQFLVAKAYQTKRLTSKELNTQVFVTAKKNEQNHDSKNRLSLGLFNKSSNLISKGKESDPTAGSNISSAASSVSKARDAVLQRGDKLQSLADKTDALSQASIDFANLTKKLNEQQSSWW